MDLGQAILDKSEQAFEKQAEEALEVNPNLAYCIRQWEKMQYEWAREEHESLKDSEVEGTKRIQDYAPFQREQFARLMGGVKKLKETSPEASWAKKIHETLDELPEWKQMRQRCRNDEYSSACATAGLSSRVLELIPKHSKNTQRARELKDLLEEDQANGELGDPEQLTKAIEDYEKALEEMQSNADSINSSSLRQAMRQAIEETNDELDDLDRAMNATGWSDENPESRTRQGAATKAAVANLLRDSEKLAKIMEMAGRMQNIWKGIKATKPDKGVSEITNIETGADIPRLLPSELMAIRHPQMKLALWRRLNERGALQYELSSKQPEGKGPIVVCVDDSGSMQGEREVWAKGLAMGLMLMARDQKRAFAYCSFSRSLTTTIKETEANRMSPVELLSEIEKFAGGGTAFEPPLNWALEVIEESETMSKADIVFISDGSCRLGDEKYYAKATERYNVTILGIAVGPDAIECKGDGSMQSFCEKVWPVSKVVPSKENKQEADAIHGVMNAGS